MAGRLASLFAHPGRMAAIALLALPGIAEAQSLNVGVDRSARISLHGTAASVIVGNPKIADVTVVDTNTLYVTGKGFGVTEIVAVDAAGRTLYQGEIVVTGGSEHSVRQWRGAKATELTCADSCSTNIRNGAPGAPPAP